METLEVDIFKDVNWSDKSIELFKDWISERKIITYEVIKRQSKRTFGQILLHAEQENIKPFCIAQGLCNICKVAIWDDNFMNGECLKFFNFFYLTSFFYRTVFIYLFIYFISMNIRCSRFNSRGFFTFKS